MISVRTFLLLCTIALVSSVAGCINVSRPLVEVSDTGYGSPRPSTVADSNDTDEIKALKDYAARLEKKLAEKDSEVKGDLAEEKAKRKKVEDDKGRMEDDRNYWKKRAEQADEQLKKRK